MKQKLMRRDGEHGLGHLPHARLVEVHKVLRGQQHGGIALADTLETVSDVLHRREIPQPQVQLIQRRDRVSFGQQHVGHVRENVEEDRGLDVARQRIQPAHAEHQEAAGSDVGMPVEEERVGTDAHGVDPQ